jgi:hypothetical protein
MFSAAERSQMIVSVGAAGRVLVAVIMSVSVLVGGNVVEMSSSVVVVVVVVRVAVSVASGPRPDVKVV